MGYCHKEIINHIKADTTMVFLPDQSPSDAQKKMLLIIPDLNLTGAMTVFTELLPLFMERDFFLYVLSPEDGSFRDKLTQQGAVVFIRPYVRCDSNYRRFLQEVFDLIFINSASCYYYAYYFMNQPVKVLWWLHETKTQLSTMQREFLNLSLLSENFILAGVTKLVVQGIKEQFNIEIENLPMPIADCYKPSKLPSAEKVTFFIPAAYTYIKGQDILLQAIAMLPPEFSERSQFVFCGYQLPGQQEYYETIKKIAQKLPTVIFLDELDRRDVYEWYQKCDCVIAPSRVDATPTTIVEALMHKKLCIVSDAAGISSYMSDCVNGFIFPSTDLQELLKRILLVIDARNELSIVADAGRMLYEENFSVTSVAEKLDKMIGNK